MHCKNAAEEGVRNLMKETAAKNQDKTIDNRYYHLNAQEFMDDGSNIDLNVKIDKETVKK